KNAPAVTGKNLRQPSAAAVFFASTHQERHWRTLRDETKVICSDWPIGQILLEVKWVGVRQPANRICLALAQWQAQDERQADRCHTDALISGPSGMFSENWTLRARRSK